MISTAYIGYIAPFDPNIPDYIKYLESCQWPTIASNYLNNSKESPGCSDEVARDVSKARFDVLSESNWAIFFLKPQANSNLIQAVELGIALASPKVTKVALIGQVLHTFHRHPKIELYSTWDNFKARNFIAL